MQINNTQYRVMQDGTEVCKGNLRQCWLYVLNTHTESTTAAELSAKLIYIEPAGKE